MGRAQDVDPEQGPNLFDAIVSSSFGAIPSSGHGAKRFKSKYALVFDQCVFKFKKHSVGRNAHHLLIMSYLQKRESPLFFFYNGSPIYVNAGYANLGNIGGARHMQIILHLGFGAASTPKNPQGISAYCCHHNSTYEYPLHVRAGAFVGRHLRAPANM